jgi:hypothetical protein
MYPSIESEQFKHNHFFKLYNCDYFPYDNVVNLGYGLMDKETHCIAGDQATAPQRWSQTSRRKTRQLLRPTQLPWQRTSLMSGKVDAVTFQHLATSIHLDIEQRKTE